MSSAAVSTAQPRMIEAPATPVQPVPLTLVLRGEAFTIPPEAHTLAGFRTWAKSAASPEQVRICFLDGEICIDMSADELETHNAAKTEVTYGIVHLNKKLKLGKLYSDRARVANVAASLSTEPDAVFFTRASLEAGRVVLVERVTTEGQYLEIEGTPDWVLEVVSDSSVRKDTRRLRQAYHRAGIPEYWLIDARGDDLEFQILIREQADYVAAEVRRGGWQASPLFRRLFRLTRKRSWGDLWEYTLQVKPMR